MPEQAGALGQFGRDPGEVAGITLRLHGFLPQHHALVVPELLHVLGAAHADHLGRFEIGRLRQQHVGHVVGLVHRVGHAGHEGKACRDLGEVPCVPEGDRRIRAVDDPHVGQRRHRHRPVVRALALEHPGQLRRAQCLAPGAVVANDGHQRLVQVARGRRRLPLLLAGRIEVLDHEAVFARLHRQMAIVARLVKAHRGADQTAGIFQRADQGRKHRAGPAAFVGTPAVVHRLAQGHGDRPQRKRLAVDHDGFADARGVEIFVGDAAYRRGLHVADGFRPFRRVLGDVLGQHLVSRPTLDVGVFTTLLVGIDDDSMGDVVTACDGGTRTRRIVGNGSSREFVPDQRLAALRIAQVKAVRRHQVRRCGAVAQEGNVEFGQAVFAHQNMDQRKQEGRIGLGPDRHPFCGAGARRRQARLHLNALVATNPRVRVANHGAGAAGHVDIGADSDHVAGIRRVGRDGEAAMPELAIEMFGMYALDALARAKAEIDRPPGGQEGRESAHVIRWCTTVPETDGDTRQAGLIDQALGAHSIELFSNKAECLVPGDRYEARILVAALLRIGALHRRQDAVRVVGLLHQAVSLDANLALGRMHVLRREIRFDLGGHAIDHLDGHEIRTRNAVVAISRNVFHGLRLDCFHAHIPQSSRA